MYIGLNRTPFDQTKEMAAPDMIDTSLTLSAGAYMYLQMNNKKSCLKRITLRVYQNKNSTTIAPHCPHFSKGK